MEKRKRVKQVSKKFQCYGNEFQSKSCLKLSVRNRQLSVYIEGESRWPHLTLKQAESLRDFLSEAIREIRVRKK